MVTLIAFSEVKLTSWMRSPKGEEEGELESAHSKKGKKRKKKNMMCRLDGAAEKRSETRFALCVVPLISSDF